MVWERKGTDALRPVQIPTPKQTDPEQYPIPQSLPHNRASWTMDWDRPSGIESILHRRPFATVWIVSSSNRHTTSVLDLSSPNCSGHLFLLFVFRFSFLLWIKLGLFLLFPFSFVFFPLITHIYFSLFENDGNESTSRRQGWNREASSFYPQITPMK